MDKLWGQPASCTQNTQQASFYLANLVMLEILSFLGMFNLNRIFYAGAFLLKRIFINILKSIAVIIIKFASMLLVWYLAKIY